MSQRGACVVSKCPQSDITIDLLKHNLKLRRIAEYVEYRATTRGKTKEINDETDVS